MSLFSDVLSSLVPMRSVAMVGCLFTCAVVAAEGVVSAMASAVVSTGAAMVVISSSEVDSFLTAQIVMSSVSTLEKKKETINCFGFMADYKLVNGEDV